MGTAMLSAFVLSGAPKANSALHYGSAHKTDDKRGEHCFSVILAQSLFPL
jgi:hypothetical protein